MSGMNPTPNDHTLFDHMSREYGLTLTSSELDEIKRIATTMNPTIPTANPPDGFDPKSEQAVDWIDQQFANSCDAAWQGELATAIEYAMAGVHALRCLMLERRADEAGVVKAGAFCEQYNNPE